MFRDKDNEPNGVSCGLVVLGFVLAVIVLTIMLVVWQSEVAAWILLGLLAGFPVLLFLAMLSNLS